MSEQQDKPQRGGKRAGAGRKKKLENPVNKVVRLETAMVKKIEDLGHEVSTFLREAGEKRLEDKW